MAVNTIEINYKWCKQCGLCAHFCPAGVFVLDDFGKPEVVEPGACIGCMQCEVRCPDFAIFVEKRIDSNA